MCLSKNCGRFYSVLYSNTLIHCLKASSSVVVIIVISFVCFFPLCSNSPGPREIPGCTGPCQVTFCSACYFSEVSRPLPGVCRICGSGAVSTVGCLKRWAKCIHKADIKENGKVSFVHVHINTHTHTHTHTHTTASSVNSD